MKAQLTWKQIPLFILLLFGQYLSAQNLPDMPNPPSLVVDLANVLSEEEEAKLVNILEEHEQHNSSQFAVVTISSTNGYPIGEYTASLGNKWQLGVKGKDNGLLLLIAIKDRKAFLATGYGMETYISDVAASTLIEEYLAPKFRREEYFEGIKNMVNATTALVEGVFVADREDYNELIKLQLAHNAKKQMENLVRFHGAIIGVGAMVWLIFFFMKTTEKEDREDLVLIRVKNDHRYLIYGVTFIVTSLINLLFLQQYYYWWAPLAAIISVVPLSYALLYGYFFIKDFLKISKVNPKELSLDQLSPAETLFLLNPTKSKGQEMIRLTLMDLTFRGILNINIHWQGRRDGDQARHLVISKGAQFTTDLKPFEKLFVEEVILEDEGSVYFREYLKDFFKKINGYKHFKKDFIGASLTEYGIFHPIYWSLNVFKLNDYGVLSQIEINKQLSTAKQSILDTLDNNPLEAVKSIHQLKGNMFAIEDLEEADLQDIAKVYLQTKEKVDNHFYEDVLSLDNQLMVSFIGLSHMDFQLFSEFSELLYTDFGIGIETAYADVFIPATSYGGSSGGGYGGFSGGGGGSFGGGGGGGGW